MLSMYKVLFIILVWRGILPLPCKWYFKIPLLMLAWAASFKFQLVKFLGGNYFSPDLPGWFILLLAWYFAVSFIFGITIILTDIALACHSAFKVIRGHLKNGCSGAKEFFKPFLKQHKWLNRIHAAALIFSIVTASVGMCFGLAMPRIRHVTVHSARLPQEAENMKIALLADLHVDAYNGPDRIRRIVELTNTLDADMICILGDFVDGKKKWHLDALSELKNLKARSGVFGVVGNHEYYSGYRVIMDHFKSIGLPILVNESVWLPQHRIRVCGITDRQAKRYKEPMPDIPKALAGAPEEFKILLSHRPDTAKEAEKHGADIQFSGHTHGGMVWGFDLIVARFNGGYAWGERQIGKLTLVISNGTCIWSSFPIRLGRPGEILLVTLKKS